MKLLLRLVAHDEALSARLALPDEAGLLRGLVLAGARSGDSPLWLVGAAAALIWGGEAWWPFGWRVVAATLVAGTIATVLKWAFRRRRPPGENRGFYSRFDRHAFPSGHAARTACTAVLLVPLLPPWSAALLAVWAVLVGICRVALRVHYLSDIAGGLLIGALTGWGLSGFLPR